LYQQFSLFLVSTQKGHVRFEKCQFLNNLLSQTSSLPLHAPIFTPLGILYGSTGGGGLWQKFSVDQNSTVRFRGLHKL